MMPEVKDPFVGRVFEDLDPRSVGRRVRVIARTTTLFAGERFRAVRLNEHGQDVPGHPLTLTRVQLETVYRPEFPFGDEARAAIAELRRAAGSVRELVGRLRWAKSRGSIADREELIALHKAMGFSRTEQALAVAAVLEEESDDAWLNLHHPSELVLVVARIVNKAAL